MIMVEPARCFGLFQLFLFGLLLCGVEASFHRDLAIGDFMELNELVRGAVIRLPDATVSADMVTFNINNLRCQNFQVGDIRLSSSKGGPQQVIVDLSIIDLDMVCRFDYQYYAALFFNGRGSAEVFSYGNDAFTSMTLSSPDLSKYPPGTLSFETCDATININDINFSAGIVGWVLNRIEGAVRSKIAAQAEAKLCETLDTWSETKIADWLLLVKEKVNLYPPGLRIDPLRMENSLAPPDIVRILNIQEKDTSPARFFHMALEEAVAYLTSETYDLSGPGPTDMNVNIILRNHVLENRALTIDIADLPFAEGDGLLWEGTDKLTSTSIRLNSVKMLGLDTFTKFEPLVDIGRHTLQNKLAWDYLTFEVDLTFNIKPSNRQDSVIVNPGSANVVERVKVAFKIDQADAIFSIMLAIDQGLLESVELGSLLKTNKIAPCLLSTIFDVGISGFALNVANIQPPTLVGFVSPGIDRVVSSAVDAAFLTYRDVLLERLPSFFQLAVRDFVNESLLSKYWSHAESKDCSWTHETSSDGGIIDLRDLFLPPNDAATAGGSGTEPYGDLFSSLLVPMLDNKFMPDDEESLPLFNSRLIRPLTKMQSGDEGSLFFPSDLFYFQKEDPTKTSSSLLQKVELRAFNSEVRNLDTVTSPLILLKPTESHLLTNGLNIGPVPDEPLTLSARLLLSIAGDDSPLEMYNDVEISVSIPSSELLVDVFAAIEKQRLLTLPLKGMDNYHCWLDTMPGSDWADDRNVYERKSLDLQRFFVTLSTLDFGVKCVECSSAGVSSISDVLDILQDAGLSIMLQPRLERLAEEIVWSYWQLLEVDRMLMEAPNRCPSSPRFDGDSLVLEGQTVPDISAPRLSLDAIETILASGVIVAETSLVVVAKSHLSATANVTDPLSGQAILEGSNNNFFDWQNLDGIVGDWIKSGIDTVRDYLAGEVEDSTGGVDLGANVLIRSLLGDDGTVSFNFDNMVTEIGGVKIKLDKMRIEGLDSVTGIGSFLEAIGPQTLTNDLTFGRLVVTFDVLVVTFDGVSATPGTETRQNDVERMSLSFGMNDVNANFALLLAADLEKLGALEMGSILRIDKIAACILSRLDEMTHITQMLVTVGSIDEPQVEGFLSPKFRYDISSVLRKTMEAFSSDIVRAMPYIFDDSVRNVLNGIIRDLRRDSESVCDWSNALLDTGMIDFRDLFLPEDMARDYGGRGDSPYGQLFRSLFENMNTRFLDASIINDFLGRWTKGQSGVAGSVWKGGNIFNSSMGISFGNLEADAQFIVSDAQVENLDSVGEPIAVLNPVQGQSNVLENLASFGVDKNFRVAGRATIAVSDGNELDLHNEVDIGLSLRSLRYALSFFLNIPQSRLFEFPLKDVFNINCWLVTILSPPSDLPFIPSAGVVSQEIEVEELNINVECVRCSSPDFDHLISHLYSPSGSEGGGSLLTKLSRQLLGGGFIRDRLLLDAAKQCPHNSAYDPDAAWGESLLNPTEAMEADKAERDQKAMMFNVAMGVVTFVILLLVIVGKWVVRKRHRKWVETLDDEGGFLLRQQESKEEKKEAFYNSNMRSMFHSLDVPRHIRWGVPFVLLADVGLFLGGHLAPISTLDLEGQVAGETFILYRFLEFSFMSSAVRSWKNGGNEMAVFVLLFSGVWPYVKLFTLAITWFIPPRWLSISQRGSVLLWMDVLAKLSVIDIMTMMLLGAFILVFIGGPGNILSESNGHYSLNTIVTPGAGFYCFVVAQRISRISSRYLLDWHRRMVTLATKEYETRHCLHTADTLFESLEQSASSEECKEEASSQCTFKSDPMEIHDCPESNHVGKSAPMTERKENGAKSTNTTCTMLRDLGWSGSAEECKEEECSLGTNQDEFEINGSPNIVSNEGRKSMLLAENNDKKIGLSSPATVTTVQESLETSESSPEVKVDFCKSVSMSKRNDESSTSDTSSQDQGRGCIKRLSRFGGTAGIVFSSITVLAVFVIGIVLAPAISLNTNSILELALEKGKTFSQATQASLFRVVSMILLNARFVLRTTNDYVAFGILFGLVGISSFLFPATQAFIKVGKWRRNRQKRKKGLLPPKKKKRKLPAYIERIYLWRGMEVYIISFVIAIWQLTAISAYAIHLYCSVLQMIYDTLSYVGLTEKAGNEQCFRIQASLPLTVMVICACFGLLSVTFLLQALGNYRENTRHVETLIENDANLSDTTRSSFWNLDSSQILIKRDISDDTFIDTEDSQQESESDSVGDRSRWLPFKSKLLRLPRVNERYRFMKDRQSLGVV